MIYLDNAATTLEYNEVRQKIYDSSLIFANPSSLHKLGQESEKEIGKARTLIAKSIFQKAKNIIFTSGATEANNTAINSLLYSSNKSGKILFSSADHPSIVKPIERLGFLGYELLDIPLENDGSLSLDFIKQNLDNDVRLITLTYINSISGIISPILKISEIISSFRKKNPHNRLLFTIDAVQGYMKGFPASNEIFTNAEIDFISFSAHKIGGPKGIGFLYAKNPDKIYPLLLGGGQENNKRSGTLPTPLILGFAKAVELAMEVSQSSPSFEKVLELSHYLTKKIEDSDKNIRIISNKYSPYINTIIVPKYPSEVLVHMLEEKEIYVSSGSACSSKSKKTSPAYKSLGLDKDEASSAIRISFSKDNTIKEIDEFDKTLQALL